MMGVLFRAVLSTKYLWMMKDASTEKVRLSLRTFVITIKLMDIRSYYRIDYKDRNGFHKDKIIANTLVVVGLLDREPYLGEEYSFIGGFKVDPNHGFQFQFNHFERQDVASISGVISYLSSDIFPEIGKKTATLIAEALGERAIELIAEDRKNLDKVKIPKNKKDIIYQVITDNKSNQEKILFFLNNGLTMEMTLRLLLFHLGIM